MIKVGPQFWPRGTSWDHKGRCEISRIFISCSQSRIHSIHFAYIEGGNKVVFSDKIGGGGEGTTSMQTITLDHPSEYITGISGGCQGSYGGPYLSSITFHTNKATYGPYVPGAIDKSSLVTDFNYEVGGRFYGFFGTYRPDGIESIGFYMKPLEKLPNAHRALLQ
ncbi:Jacalin-type lectin domain-containing protein [Heracleum sosnowskyi]|uniref:Jacalin-type lectin domain-containing protein n=1 Tax=Heracleum sosnowskyi TaxID=360622 RepID=A0AAD8N0H8_9APIA|nr:Jacalin-type lectin domain-containing protein [Heracleum sosnowskyi]